jgi:hypothetical protein
VRYDFASGIVLVVADESAATYFHIIWGIYEIPSPHVCMLIQLPFYGHVPLQPVLTRACVVDVIDSVLQQPNTVGSSQAH